MAGITVSAMRSTLRSLGNEKIAAHSSGFFKAFPGGYGEGDRFLGIRVPVVRKQVSAFRDAPLRAVRSLLRSQYHEERLFAVLLMADQYRRGDAEHRQRIYDLYMDSRDCVNNWDIVDSSAHLIVGPHLENGDRSVLVGLASSDVLWDRRISMMATYHYIRQGDFRDAFRIAKLLRDDEHDLIHKVVGWMLREIGNRDRDAEERFLKTHYRKMPRTMLRYAIEKFPEQRRKAYLHGTV